jgi:hypothetical protein
MDVLLYSSHACMFGLGSHMNEGGFLRAIQSRYNPQKDQ